MSLSISLFVNLDFLAFGQPVEYWVCMLVLLGRVAHDRLAFGPGTRGRYRRLHNYEHQCQFVLPMQTNTYLGSHHRFALSQDLFFGSAASVQLLTWRIAARNIARPVFFVSLLRLEPLADHKLFVMVVVGGRGWLVRAYVCSITA